MRQTETVVTEEVEEVEYVYCDECGDECTGDVCYTANEVCRSCADNRKAVIFNSVRELYSEFAHTWTEDKNVTLGPQVMLIVLSPLVYLFTLGDRSEGPGYKLETAYTTGLILYMIGLGIGIGIFL